MEEWRPAVDFGKCYLSVSHDRLSRVYLSREVYWLMGRPKWVNVEVGENTVAISPSDAQRGGLPIKLNPAGQPYIVHHLLGSRIGPGNRVLFDYDEQVRDARGRFAGPRKFYFSLKKRK